MIDNVSYHNDGMAHCRIMSQLWKSSGECVDNSLLAVGNLWRAGPLVWKAVDMQWRQVRTLRGRPATTLQMAGG